MHNATILIDKLISCPNTQDALRAQLRNAERFYFPLPQHCYHLYEHGLTSNRLDYINKMIPIAAKFPFKTCWFECEMPATRHHEGFLITTDDTYQRGRIDYQRDPSIVPRFFNPNIKIKFDFTDTFLPDSRRKILFINYNYFWSKNEIDDYHLLTSRFSCDPAEDQAFFLHGGVFLVLASLIALNGTALIQNDRTDISSSQFTEEYACLEDLTSFRVVTIAGPTQPSLGPMAARTESTGSPGRHSVRGHCRYSKHRSQSWVPPHYRGAGPCKRPRVAYKVQASGHRK